MWNKEIRHETAIMVKEMEQQAKDEAEKKAKEIISLLSNVVQLTM